MTEFFLPLAFYRPSFTGFNEIIKLKHLIILLTFLICNGFVSKSFDVDFFQQLLRVVPDQKARRWKEWNWSLNFENNAFVAI